MEYAIKRRASSRVYVGSVPVGDGAPVSIQTMTNTLTTDVSGTLAQINSAYEAGVDIVRVSCPDKESCDALKAITKESPVPVVADIHFNYRWGIKAAENGAACIRFNPGNIGSEARVKELLKAVRDYGVSMRIGVNAGSLDKHLLEKYKEPCPEAMVESALAHAKVLEDNDFFNFKISVKASNVFLMAASYRLLAQRCSYPLHLGVTEAGGLRAGTVKSAIGIGSLLWDGIGDTIRVSLSADIREEVLVAREILASLYLNNKGVTIISCPSCARQQFDVVKTVAILEERLSYIQEPLKISIIGCIVNGPGEAAYTDIGFVGGGKDYHQIFLNGDMVGKFSIPDVVSYVEQLCLEAIEKRKALAS